MLDIKKEEPIFFKEIKKNILQTKVSSAWKENSVRNISHILREHILLDEQELLCCYCEKEIDESSEVSNIDHFKTRNLFPNLTLDYNNLVVSCNANKQCSSYKDKHVKSQKDYENIVNPVLENPNEYFDYLLTGEIFPRDNLRDSARKKAIFTIKIFQLNSTKQVNSRKEISRFLFHLKSDHTPTLNAVYNYIKDYKGFTSNIYEKIFT